MKNLRNTLITLLLMFVVFIPTKVFAENYGEDFKKILTNGKLVINSVPPKTVPDTYYIIHELPFYDENGNSKFEDLRGYFSVESIDEDYNSVSIDYTDKTTYQLIENHEVPIQYNYDKNILKEVEKLVKGLPREKDFYVIDDMEILNFWINGKADDYSGIDNYSTELRSYFKNKNLNFYVDNRAGFYGDFVEGRMGIASIRYNGTVYYVDHTLSTRAYSIFYVPDDTTDNLKAIQKRINDYVGHDKYKVTKVGKISEYIEDYIEGIQAYWREMYDAEVVAVNGYKQECLANNANNPELCDYFDTDYAYLASYEAYIEHNGYTTDGDEALALLADYEDEDYYKMTINGEERLFIVLKDSERMKNPEYISSDLVTDVSISSKSTKVPLDTLVGAEELTSGEEYDRVLNKLRYTKGVTFDLSLYSKSLQDYITKLDDTTFKVSIPIPSELEGKKLTVYYVAKDGTLEEHEVTVEGGYATFITNHFSVYSLVDKDSINPDTGDNISLYIALMLFSVIGLVGIKYFKKNN